MASNPRTTPVRIPAETAARVDGVIPTLSKLDPRFATVRQSRANAVALLLHKALEDVEGAQNDGGLFGSASLLFPPKTAH